MTKLTTSLRCIISYRKNEEKNFKKCPVLTEAKIVVDCGVGPGGFITVAEGTLGGSWNQGQVLVEFRKKAKLSDSKPFILNYNGLKMAQGLNLV